MNPYTDPVREVVSAFLACPDGINQDLELALVGLLRAHTEIQREAVRMRIQELTQGGSCPQE